MSSTLFSGVASAQSANQNMTSNSTKHVVHIGERPELTASQTLASLTNDPIETKEVREVHKKVINGGFASLTSDGQIVVNTTAADLGVDFDLFAKYLINMQDINQVIRKGGISFDDHFEIKVANPSEIADKISGNDDQIYTPMYDPDAPYLSAYIIARSNYNALYSDWAALALGIYGNPLAAYTYTLAEWVKKVKPGGVWDYKAVPGYTPYNKLWTAILKNSREYKTSEWFGNYNYGYTGKLLFSLSILYTGGDVVSQITGGAPDDFEDKAAIAQGYNENS